MKKDKKVVPMSEKAKEHIEKVEKQLEANIQADDFSHYVTPHLFESTQRVLRNHVPALKDHNYEVKFLGIRGPTSDLFEAGKRLADKINEACRAFQTVGILGVPLKMDVSLDPAKPDQPAESIFVAYIAFSPEAARVIDKLIRLDQQTVFFIPGTVKKEPGQ